MKIKATTILAGLCLLQSAMGLIYAQTWQNLITNIENRQVTTLNGMWKYIVDPYESGYYDYRRQVRDQQSWQNTAEALYLAHKPAHKGERVEYDFDKSDNIIVPGIGIHKRRSSFTMRELSGTTRNLSSLLLQACQGSFSILGRQTTRAMFI